MRGARRLVGSLTYRVLPQYEAIRVAERHNSAFDAAFGTQTRGEIPLPAVAVPREQAARANGVYRATPDPLFFAAMRAVAVQPADYAFVDFGSGAGKALMLAAAYGFRDVRGVELSPVLHERALGNLETARSRGLLGAAEVRSFCGDAASFDVPESPLVCFFFNPFCTEVWHAVLERLSASYRARPRPIHIAYVNIRHTRELGGVLDEFPAFAPRMQDDHVVVRSTA